jgi:hypothetical protein
MDHDRQYKRSVKEWIVRFEKALSREIQPERQESLRQAIALAKELQEQELS